MTTEKREMNDYRDLDPIREGFYKFFGKPFLMKHERRKYF
jgi:hypothetical protein